MKKIPLSKGAFALVDDCDYAFLSQFKWKLSSHGYAQRSLYLGSETGKPKYSSEFMHRIILGLKKGEHCDHKNGVRHDNRRENLRKCTHKENCRNKKPQINKRYSKYIGVTYCVRDKRWIAQLRQNDIHLLRKGFATEMDAALAYDAAARTYHKEFSRLNFPNNA